MTDSLLGTGFSLVRGDNGQAVDNGCPICGAAQGGASHRCPPRVLAAIDAAHRRDTDDEEATRDYRTYGGRLSDGFGLFGEGDDE